MEKKFSQHSTRKEIGRLVPQSEKWLEHEWEKYKKKKEMKEATRNKLGNKSSGGSRSRASAAMPHMKYQLLLLTAYLRFCFFFLPLVFVPSAPTSPYGNLSRAIFTLTRHTHRHRGVRLESPADRQWERSYNAHTSLCLWDDEKLPTIN